VSRDNQKVGSESRSCRQKPAAKEGDGVSISGDFSKFLAVNFFHCTKIMVQGLENFTKIAQK
jgi:hypothetical protein